MRYPQVVKGTFIDRPNRFIAHVVIDGVKETVHVKNTGRCKELLIEGCNVILEKCDNPSRKTKYDLIAVYKEGFGLINIDSQAPNKVVYEWLKQKMLMILLRVNIVMGNPVSTFTWRRVMKSF